MRLTKKSIDFNRRSDNNLNIITKQLYYINVDLKRLKGVCLRYDTPSSVFLQNLPIVRSHGCGAVEWRFYDKSSGFCVYYNK